MIYTTDIIGYQWDIFIRALALGVLLGGCYDVLRVFRILVPFGKKLFIASDFIYCVFGAFIIFSFLLNENFGMPRLYIYAGIAGGFFGWYFTFGRLAAKIAKALRKILKVLLKPFVKIFRKIIKKAENKLYKAKIFLQKTLDNPKKLLKKNVKVVYNILCLNMLKVFSFCGGKAGKEPEKVESNGTEKTEKGNFSQDRSYCIRGLSAVFPDIHSDEHQQKTNRT
ncbi:MAG: spore cortex biosynthesis protein YabQ [Oscillospiraceae bacterium]|nr:spore cortex biosynthesis protein YabQ [Oscillospiraceae bacterium]